MRTSVTSLSAVLTYFLQQPTWALVLQLWQSCGAALWPRGTAVCTLPKNPGRVINEEKHIVCDARQKDQHFPVSPQSCEEPSTAVTPILPWTPTHFPTPRPHPPHNSRTSSMTLKIKTPAPESASKKRIKVIFQVDSIY